MNINVLINKLRRYDFYIHRVTAIAHGHQIHLGCGIRICAYRNGSVLVQGKFLGESQAESLPILQTILPLTTSWRFSGVNSAKTSEEPIISEALMEKIRIALAR